MKRTLHLIFLLCLSFFVKAQIVGDVTFNPTDIGYNSFSGVAGSSNPTNPASVYAQALQPDGKIILGGGIHSYNGEPSLNTSNASVNLLRLNADGSRDTTFNPGGIGTNNLVRAVAVQPDGKILIGGMFTSYNGIPINRICRLNADGTFDPTFNPALGPSNVVYHILVLPSGKIMVGGGFTTFNAQNVKHLVRLNSNGSFDATFNSGEAGFGISGASLSWSVRSIAQQPDGKLLVGGSFLSFNGVTAKAIMRIEENGSVDTTFKSPNAEIASTTPTVYTISLLPNGKLFLGGNNIGINSSNQSGIMLLNANGSVDASFQPGPGASSSNIIYAIVPLANNQLLIGGDFPQFGSNTVRRLARLNANGSVDASFALGNSIYLTGTIASIQMLGDSSFVYSGGFNNSLSGGNNSVEKLTKNFIIDTKFNEVTGAKSGVNTFAVQADSKIMIGGQFTTFNKISRGRIARLTSNGDLDETYAPFKGANADVNSVIVQPDGKVIAAGAFTTFNDTAAGRIIRTDAFGNIDTAFWNRIGTGANGSITVMRRQPDGKILLGGNFVYFNGIVANYIVRLNADGTVDNTFNIGSGAFGYVTDIALQPDGKVVVCGNFPFFNTSSCKGIVRLNSNGSIDASFNCGTGFSYLPIKKLLVAPNGGIFVGKITSGNYNGSGYGNRLIVKLKPNGTIDSSFYYPYSLEDSVVTMDLYSNGKLLVGCNTNGGSSLSTSFSRANTDGTIDATFTFGSVGTAIKTGNASQVMLLENGSKMLFAGTFTTFINIGRNRIGRAIDASITAVPITLHSFTAKQLGNDALLEWQSVNEVNMDRFVLERSTDNLHFTGLSSITCKGSLANSYAYTDAGIDALNSPTIYYRLKMLEKDGKTSYSQIVLVKMKTKTAISFAPNPTKGMATLQLQGTMNEQVQIGIYDLSGKKLLGQTNTISAGSISIPIDLSSLQQGIYLLNVKSNLRNETLKIVKQ